MVRKIRRKKAGEADDNLERWQEWQRHQYDPGYYVGKLHPLFTNNRRPRLFGWFLVISASIFFVAAIAGTIISGNGWSSLSSLLPVSIFLALYFLVGLRFLQKGRK